MATMASAWRQWVVRERELPQLLDLVAYQRAGDVQHGRRRVGGDDPVPGGDQRLGEQPCAAAKLQDEALTSPYVAETSKR